MQHSNRFVNYQCAGLTMIEVLVTLTIMSIGLLGMAAMQVTGVRSVSSSSLRTQASVLANDMAERMRANTTAIDANAFMNVSSASIDCTTLPSPYCAEHYDGSTIVAAQDCTSAQMAAFDINVWFCGIDSGGSRKGGVQEYLPAAQAGTPSATITCTDTDPTGGDADPCTNTASPHQITLNWSEINPSTQGGTATITQSVTLNVQQ